jgi:hypothetical protein
MVSAVSCVCDTPRVASHNSTNALGNMESRGLKDPSGSCVATKVYISSVVSLVIEPRT